MSLLVPISSPATKKSNSLQKVENGTIKDSIIIDVKNIFKLNIKKTK